MEKSCYNIEGELVIPIRGVFPVSDSGTKAEKIRNSSDI